MSEHDCQRKLIEALSLTDEYTISRRRDAALRLRELAALNAAKLCLRRQYSKVGMSGRAVELALAELTVVESQRA
jgi:hypothetical protein